MQYRCVEKYGIVLNMERCKLKIPKFDLRKIACICSKCLIFGSGNILWFQNTIYGTEYDLNCLVNSCSLCLGVYKCNLLSFDKAVCSDNVHIIFHHLCSQIICDTWGQIVLVWICHLACLVLSISFAISLLSAT